MTFKEWYKAYNPEIDMDCDINLDELLSCWYAAYEWGYARGWADNCRQTDALNRVAQMGQEFDEYGHYGENNPPLDMSKVGDKDYKC